MNKKVLSKLCFALFALSFLGSVQIATSRDIDFVEIRLDNYEFKIPKENSLDRVSSNWFRWVPGLDDSQKDTIFSVSAEKISASINNYKKADGRYVENITGLIAVLTQVEKERYVSPTKFSDLWSSTDSYKQRIVEACGTGCYKVFRKIEYPYSWALLKIAPQSELPMPKKISDFWIAHCLEAKGTITKSGRHVECTSYIVLDNFLIEFNVSEQNLEHIDLIRDYLAKTVSSWQIKNQEPNLGSPISRPVSIEQSKP